MLKMKFENKENKQKIGMLNEFDFISKKSKLHENEICRIHAFMKKLGVDKGLIVAPLVRLKKTLKRQNDVIQNFGVNKEIAAKSEDKAKEKEHIPQQISPKYNRTKSAGFSRKRVLLVNNIRL